jgi:hypothetical protein
MSRCKRDALAAWRTEHKMVGVEGFEHSISRFRSEHSGLAELNPVGALAGSRTRRFRLRRPRAGPSARGLVGVEGLAPPSACAQGMPSAADLHSVWRTRRESNPLIRRDRAAPRPHGSGCSIDRRALAWTGASATELVGCRGVEPRTNGLRVRCAATCASNPNWNALTDSNRDSTLIRRVSCHWTKGAGKWWVPGRVERLAPRDCVCSAARGPPLLTVGTRIGAP